MKGYGWHLFEALLQTRPHAFKKIWVQKQKSPSEKQALAAQQLKAVGLTFEQSEKVALDKLAEGGVHQGVVFDFIPRDQISEYEWFEKIQADTSIPCVVLVLDGITDPQNFGAILRSAEGFGVTAVLVPQDKSATMTATTLKAASGATEHLDVVVVKNLARSLEALKAARIWVWGTDLAQSENLVGLKVPARVAFVLGREGEGLRELTRKTCDQRVHIPLLGKGQSLNVSVATGIFLYHYRTQHPK